MNEINTQVKQPHFVWIGAGEAIDTRLMDQFVEAYPSGKVVFLEARDSAVDQLLKQYHGQDKYTILRTLVDVTAKPTTFYILNLPEFSSLRQPTGLVDLFPGVAIYKSDLIDTQTINGCLERLEIDDDQSNHLYIDVPAQAGELIRKLIDDGTIYMFAVVHLALSIKSLYDEDEKADLIVALLAEHGFSVDYQDNTDPDMPIISFHLNPLWQTFCDVKQQLIDTKKSNNTIAKQLDSKLQEAVNQQNKIVELTRILEEKEIFLVEITGSVEEIEGELAEKNTVIQELRIEFSEKQKWLTEHEKWNNGLKSELALLLEQIQEKDDQLQNMINDQAINANELKVKEQAYQEQLFRNQSLEKEVIKLEAQLELIKDVILRDKAF
ncbi:hypothetical protein [Neptunomonas sp.]|uniref:hypothetical protein n=1 Tax=Neptunomonas sp. TaxID=1971898 RepID=UPI00356A56B5